MVLHLKVWESKSLPSLSATAFFFDAGWSSPVARQAHNLKVVGSNPTPATKMTNTIRNITIIALLILILYILYQTQEPLLKKVKKA